MIKRIIILFVICCIFSGCASRFERIVRAEALKHGAKSDIVTTLAEYGDPLDNFYNKYYPELGEDHDQYMIFVRIKYPGYPRHNQPSMKYKFYFMDGDFVKKQEKEITWLTEYLTPWF